MSMKCSEGRERNRPLRIGLAVGAILLIALCVQRPIVAEQSSSDLTWDLSPRLAAGLKAAISIKESCQTRARHGAIKSKDRHSAREIELLMAVTAGTEHVDARECKATIQRIAHKDDHPLHPLNFAAERGRDQDLASDATEDAAKDVAHVAAPVGEHRIDRRVTRLRALLGVSASLMLDARAPRQAATGAPEAAAILTQIFSERPPHPVAKNEEWRGVRIAQIPGVGAVEILTTSRLKEIREQGLHRYAEIEVVVSGRHLPVEDAPESYQLESLAGKGTKTIDVDSGMLVNESLKIEVILISDTTRLTCNSESSISIHLLR